MIYQKMTKYGLYNFTCRCFCSHGRDLYKWGKCQIEKGSLWHNPHTGRDEDIYIPNVEEVLTKDEIALIRIKNTDEYKGNYDSEVVKNQTELAIDELEKVMTL